jgi:predicted RNA binding protein YcfA (HicA-like mRNA interferase family)
MSKLPSLTGEQIVKALIAGEFKIQRQRGSHIYLKHSDGRATVVPVHKGESIGMGLLRKIIRDVEMDKDDFLQLLRYEILALPIIGGNVDYLKWLTKRRACSEFL